MRRSPERRKHLTSQRSKRMTEKSFKSFIKSLQADELISKNRSGFADWMRNKGTDSEKNYRTAIKKAISDANRAKPSYGKAGEALAKGGLLGSGIEEYLEKSEKKATRDAISELKSTRLLESAKNLEGYKEAISIEENKTAVNYDEILKEMKGSNMTSIESAYGYAIKCGLGKKQALEAADEATRAVRERIVLMISERIVEQKLSPKKAARYARIYDLPDEDIDALEDFARDMYYVVDKHGYFDYIKDKASGKQ